MTRFLLHGYFFDTNHQRKIPILGGLCSEWHWDKSYFKQNSAVIWFSAHILQYILTLLNDGLQIVYYKYPLKLKVFGALWSPFFTNGNWLSTFHNSQWCEDRNVNRIEPEYNQSTQKSYISNMRPNFSFTYLVSSCFAMCKHTLPFRMFGPFWSVWCKMAQAEVGVSLPW